MHYSTIVTNISEISNRIIDLRKKLVQLREQITNGRQALDKLSTQYGDFIANIEQAANENPSDVALQNAKAEKDKLVQEFSHLKSQAELMETGVADADL